MEEYEVLVSLANRVCTGAGERVRDLLGASARVLAKLVRGQVGERNRDQDRNQRHRNHDLDEREAAGVARFLHGFSVGGVRTLLHRADR